MNHLESEQFLKDYSLIKYSLDKKICYGCEEKYVHSLRYHTCYYDNFEQLVMNNDLAIEIVLNRYGINLNESDLKRLCDWIVETESLIKNTLFPIKMFKDIFN